MNILTALASRRFLVAALVALFSALLFKLSYYQEYPEAYLFPRIVATAMLLLSLLSLFRELFDLCMDDFKAFPFMRQLPGIVLMVIGVSMVEEVGIYITSFLLLTIMMLLYSPKPDWKSRVIRSVLIATVFTGFMYVLFTLLLRVQVPMNPLFL